MLQVPYCLSHCLYVVCINEGSLIAEDASLKRDLKTGTYRLYQPNVRCSGRHFAYLQ